MKLFDRFSKTNKEINLREDIKVYVCGPTVYDHAHIGHGRSLIVFDILHRLLAHQTNVSFAQNITDIADQILQRAEKENVSEQTIIDKYTESYNNTCKYLNIKNFTYQPKPTEYIDQMIKCIEKLIENKRAVIKEDGIYMVIDETYGVFSPNCERKPFALWMFKPNYSFESPWGKGRPGWHIECSVMSHELFGDKFHIHGGGSDLMFPHHENEIAQSRGLNDCVPADIWMHNNMINIKGEKMSKSLGNFKYLNDIVLNSFDADMLRLLFLSYSYDVVIELTDEVVEKTRNTLKNIRVQLFMNKAKVLEEPSKKLVEILNDNLNTVDGLNYINRLICNNQFDQALTDLRFLGFFIEPITKISPKEIAALVSKRQVAKQNHDFNLADKIRQQLTNNNVMLCDNNNHTSWFYM